jgi:hypothetical protein
LAPLTSEVGEIIEVLVLGNKKNKVEILDEVYLIKKDSYNFLLSKILVKS